MTKSLTHINDAVGIVFSSRAYVALGVASFVVLFTLYAFTLPATYTGGNVGLVSLQYLNVRLGLFAFIFSVAIALLVPFSVYAFRTHARNASAAAAGGIVGSVLPSLLCCSPLLPSLAALVGGVFPFAFGASGFLQGFIATYETEIYVGIVFVLVYSIFLNAKQVVFAERQMCDI